MKSDTALPKMFVPTSDFAVDSVSGRADMRRNATLKSFRKCWPAGDALKRYGARGVGGQEVDLAEQV